MEGQKSFFHVAGLGSNASVQITGQAPKKLHLSMGDGPISYRVICKDAKGIETKAYMIENKKNHIMVYNNFTLLAFFFGRLAGTHAGNFAV